MFRIRRGRSWWATAACVAAVVLTAHQAAQASVVVYGSLSNFDVYNRTGDYCHGFEIEMEGVELDDVYSLYNPWGYVTSTTATATGVKVIYDGRSPLIQVPDGGMKHYGVHLYSTPTKVTYNWLATDGLGQLVHAPVGAPTPPPVPLPTPVWQTSATGVTAGVYNSGTRPLWLKALHGTQDAAAVLEQLLIDSALITSLGDEEEVEPQLLDPGDTLDEVEDLLDAMAVGGRAVFWVYEYTGEVDDSGNAVGEPTFEDTAGDMIGIVMTAVNFIPEPATLAMLGLGIMVCLRRNRGVTRR